MGRLHAERGRTVAVVLHDLNLAAMYCDEVALMQGGRVVAAGPPETVLTEERIEAVFGVRAQVGVSALHGRLLVQFRPG